MNRITKESSITVFEVSPTAAGGILILVSENANELSVFSEQETKLQQTSLINYCYIENINAEILPAYLSQVKPNEISTLSFFETNSLSDCFVFAQKVALEGAKFIDFRVLRSVQNRCVLVYESKNADPLAITIKTPSETVKSYFQILK